MGLICGWMKEEEKVTKFGVFAAYVRIVGNSFMFLNQSRRWPVRRLPLDFATFRDVARAGFGLAGLGRQS